MALASKGLSTEINEDDTIRIVFLVNFETPSYIKGYHEYQKIWTPFLQEEFCEEMEPANPADKYAVAVKKNNVVVGDLPLKCSGKFVKTIFYFLNRGDGDGIQVPCLLKFHGQKILIGILKQQLDVMKQLLLLLYYICILVLLYHRKRENNEVIPPFFSTYQATHPML